MLSLMSLAQKDKREELTAETEYHALVNASLWFRTYQESMLVLNTFRHRAHFLKSDFIKYSDHHHHFSHSITS